MKSEDFQLLAGILKQRSGLSLTEEKVYLLESRLTPVARKLGLERLEDLIEKVRSDRSEVLLKDVTEAMTTNESFFFRDGQPFETFRNELLPRLVRARADRKLIRIWCAAASTGQEPSSLAMILKEQAAALAGWRVEIVATDISADVLERAKVGIYTQFEVQRGLPIRRLMAHFTQVNEMWQIDASIRAMVSFRQFNLLDDPAPLGSFDIIFCRNVLIYFDQETKARVLDSIAGLLPQDGCLLLGAAETVLGISQALKPMEGHRGVYALAA